MTPRKAVRIAKEIVALLRDEMETDGQMNDPLFKDMSEVVLRLSNLEKIL